MNVRPSNIIFEDLQNRIFSFNGTNNTDDDWLGNIIQTLITAY